ncbi:hypothetical protein [Jannaschia rubra]|uniref:Uncharacterized protein n=1 Tax=Jannaschia rubra TaxID=282197 RepID=A0A0M6XQM5_9RHOB|nr:hypothetical protein [Jannaschia rubra]CTQ32897.1 hypothetical protein JAN5088_01670 [Jannaschia rubra]SFG28172.1 hypothetical protein SAMN04488517_103448 [Jannaschia rubra]
MRELAEDVADLELRSMLCDTTRDIGGVVRDSTADIDASPSLRDPPELDPLMGVCLAAAALAPFALIAALVL